MQKVIIIKEECHGVIGVAASYHDAIDFLMESEWIDEDTAVWCENLMEWKTLKELELWNEHIYEMPEEFWEGQFYFTWRNFYGTLPKENTDEVW